MSEAERVAALEAKLGALTARLNALAEGNLEIVAEGHRIGSTRLLEKLVSATGHDDEYHLHQRDSEGTESDLTGARSIQGIPVSEVVPTTTQIYGYNATTNQWEPTAAGAAAAHEATHRSGGADPLSHDNIAGVSANDHHNESHAPESHTGTDITGAQLETLSDGSTAGGLHVHVEAEVTDLDHATPAVTAVEAANPLDMTNAIQVDDINEHTATDGVTIDASEGAGQGTWIVDDKIYPRKDITDAYLSVNALGDLYWYGDLTDNDVFFFDESLNRWLFYVGGAIKFGIYGDAGEAYIASNLNHDFAAGIDVTGTLTVDTIGEKTGAAGVTVDGVTLKDDAVEVDAIRGLKESGGQALDMGAVADGEYLKRSGTNVIGDTPAGGGGGVSTALAFYMGA